MKLPFNETQLRKDSREASDAGLLIWRKNFSAFIPFFAVPFALFAIILRVILPDNYRYLSWIIIWLLKPLFDRLILHVISIRFFDQHAKLKQLLRGLGKTIKRGLIGDLLWRRFTPYRSAMMPVRVLETNINSQAKYKERKKNLEKGGLLFCVFLTIWGMAVEAALLTGAAVFFISIFDLVTGQIVLILDNIKYLEILLFSAWCADLILVESIYVCMGFSLYINSRTETEGWDIEIIFKNIAEKFKTVKNAALAVFLLMFLTMPAVSHADDLYNQEPLNKAPIETLNKILESPEFGGVEETWGIRFKNNSGNEDEISIDSDQLTRVQRIFAYMLRLFLISIITALLIFLLFNLYKNTERKKTKEKNHLESFINFNHSLDPELLLKKAANFYKQGELRLAWGYCTAASIQLWSLYTGVIFPANATENDCADLIEKTVGNNSDIALNLQNASSPVTPLQAQAVIIIKLIKTWILFVYAGHVPSDGKFDEALNFCMSLAASGKPGTRNE